ncbi:DUF2927 domain-containing protein [Rhodophyticola sp. SM2404]
MPSAQISDVAERRVVALPDIMPSMASFGAPNPTPPSRSNIAIAEDILDLSFAMETGRQLETISRFEGPISVTIAPGAPENLSIDLGRLLGRMRREARIDISQVPFSSEQNASVTIETLPRARMQRVVPQAACFVVPRISSWSEFRSQRGQRSLDWTTLQTRERVAVFIPNDVSPQEMRDCLHEEVSQAIGPLNDLYRLPDSVFNDDNFNAVLTGFDMLVLRVYNSDSLRSGMTRGEVAAALPNLLARFNPNGAGRDGGPSSDTPRAWIDAIETALGGTANGARRIAAAQRAVSIATEAGWNDNRTAFGYFVLGRLSLARDAEASFTAFQSASRIYSQLDPQSVQLAHVRMQLAAFALSNGDAEAALQLTGLATPVARRAENAALLSTLLMMRAEALALSGRASEARTVRLDSLAWGRYGFGREAAVEERLTEIASLAPAI